jgi:hypothetical protein
MTDFNASDRDVSRAIRSWLHEDRREDASRIAGAVLDQVEAAPERRAGWPAWRTPTMNRFITFGLGAAAVVVIGLLLGAQLLGSPDNTGTGGPTATPEATATPPSSVEPTGTPWVGLPEGPFAYFGPDMPDLAADAPRITLTIPAPGWSELDAGVLIKGNDLDNLPEAAIISWSESPGAEFYVYGDPCAYESTTPDTPATTVDEIVAALAAQASRNASEPMDVTVDGYAGKTIILHVPDDADTAACEGGEFAMFGTEQDDFARYNQGPGQIDELWIIDVEGSIVIFDTMYRPDTSTELIEEMRDLVGSATFEVP